MPVRSLHSCVLRWPEPRQVLCALQTWIRDRAAETPELLGAACIGSYARGDAGPGSDLDLVLVVSNAPSDRAQRHAAWPVERLPVPTDLWVLTAAEWDALPANSRFARVLRQEARWLYLAPGWQPWPAHPRHETKAPDRGAGE